MSNNKDTFKFDAIVRARINDNGIKILEGRASSNSKDSFDTIMNSDCLRGFLDDASSKLIPIEFTHGNKDRDNRLFKRIGKLTNATINSEGDKEYFDVTIELNNNPFSDWAFELIENPEKELGENIALGMSIEGNIEKYHYETIDGKSTKVFDRVRLTHIAVHDTPSNPDTWLEAISRAAKSEINNNNESEKLMDKTNEIINNDIPSEATTSEETTRALEIDEKGNVELANFQSELRQIASDLTNAIVTMSETNLSADLIMIAICEFMDKFEDKLEMLKQWIEYGYIKINDSMQRSEYVKNSQNVFLGQLEKINIKLKETRQNESDEQTKQSFSSEGNSETQCSNPSSIGQVIREDNKENNKMENETTTETTTVESTNETAPKTVEAKVEVRNDTSELLKAISTLTAMVEKLDNENKEVRSKIDEISKQPASVPANVPNVPSTIERASSVISSKEEFEKLSRSQQTAVRNALVLTAMSPKKAK